MLGLGWGVVGLKNGTINTLGYLTVAANSQIHKGHEHLLSYSTSNMHVNTMVWPCSGGVTTYFHMFEGGP